MQGIFILGFFFFFLFAISGYYFYKIAHKKLSKYFLDNMYRINGSFALMIYLYGLKPLIKGAIHGFGYENNELQLYCLMSI